MTPPVITVPVSLARGLAGNTTAIGNQSSGINQSLTGTRQILGDDSLLASAGNPPPVVATANAAGTARTISQSGNWNAVKNAAIRHDANEALVVSKFVAVDILTGDLSQTITVDQVKRGVIETGAGNDWIVVNAYSDASGTGNGILISTGFGNDTVLFTGAAKKTEASILLGDGNDQVTIATTRRAVADGGAGDDTFTVDLSGEFWIEGGTGNDKLKLGFSSGGLEIARFNDSLAVRQAGVTGAAITMFDHIDLLDLSDRAGVDVTLISLALQSQAVGRFVSLASVLPAAPIAPPASNARPSDAYVQTITVEGDAAIVATDATPTFYIMKKGTVVGGSGDDTYQTSSQGALTELPGGGVDTVITYQSSAATLKNGFENLTYMAANNTSVSGNAADNIIIAGAGNNIIDGRGGNDILTGNAGKDYFTLYHGTGHDRITDFTFTDDKVRLGQGTLHNFADVQAKLVQIGSDAVLWFDADNSLTFLNKNVANLTGQNFDFAPDLSKYSYLTFEDNFDTLSLFNGRNVDGGVWRPRHAFGNGEQNRPSELQTYVHPGWEDLGYSPFSINDGKLAIKVERTPVEYRGLVDDAAHPYMSGMISTQGTFAQTYGFYEGRFKLPAGYGYFPAFWMMPANLVWPPEIDVFEGVGPYPTEVFQMGNYVKGLIDTSDGFHTYGLEWLPDRLAWYIDGVQTYVRYGTTYDKPMHLIVNLAIASDWALAPPLSAGGVQTGQMEIDYIRVYSATPAPVFAAAPRVSFAHDNVPVGTAFTDAFKYVADTSGPISFSHDDMFLTNPTWGSAQVQNSREADSYYAWVQGGWGSLRNAKVEDADGGKIQLKDFVTMEVQLGGAKNSEVLLTNPQNALVLTDEGNDTIRVFSVTGTRAGIPQEVTIRSGGGNDTIQGWSGTTNRMIIDAGSGNDTITASGASDSIKGGTGNDTITTGTGLDVVIIRAGDGADTVTDFIAGSDRIRFEGVAQPQVTMTDGPTGAVIDYGSGTVVLTGVLIADIGSAFDFV